jgi:tyrosyl-tRNA synthetase
MSRPGLDEQVDLLMRGTAFADEVGLTEEEAAPPGPEPAAGGGGRVAAPRRGGRLRAQMRAELRAALERAEKEGRPLRVYQGFDPTSASLHIGHMVSAHKLREFQCLGHKAIFLIGDYTAMIGDPSGQSQERKQLTHEEALENARLYTDQAFRLLEPAGTEVRRNSEWLSKLDFAQLIKLASLFPLKQIIARRDFQQRLERGDSLRFHECLYALMQGYDAFALECDVQVGAYDQHFNMLAGRIIQQRYGQSPHVMLTMPLLMGTDGRKMSKSYGNAIPLADTPADVYGKTMRINDELIPQYLDLATTLPPAEIDRHKQALADGKVNPKDVKKAIAWNIAAQYHGEAGAREGEEAFRRLSELREAPADIDAAELEVGPDGEWLPRALATLGLVKSSSEGRRLVEAGAVSLDDERVSDPEARLRPGLSKALVRVGKRRYLRVTTR